MFYRGIPAYVVVSSACGRVANYYSFKKHSLIHPQALVEIERWPIDQLISHLRTHNNCPYVSQVIWKRLYKTSSGMEKGTLYHLRNLINRRNITKRPKNNVNAAEDFLEVVIVSYILTAVMTLLGMKSLHDIPSSPLVTQDVWMVDDAARREILTDISTRVVEKFVDLATTFKKITPEDEGTVYDYECEVMSLGLLFMDFKDAIREGDGNRVLLIWKYLLLLFKASGRTHYSIEALTILTQYQIVLPPNLAEQLKWSRFVNTVGLPGHNISCDLQNEHLNSEGSY